IEQGNVYSRFNWSQPGYVWKNYPSPGITSDNFPLICTVIKTYICPSSSVAPTWNWDGTSNDNSPGSLQKDGWNAMASLEYRGITGPDRHAQVRPPLRTSYRDSKPKLTAITDGTSNTMVIGEYSGLVPGEMTSPWGGCAFNQVQWDKGCVDDGIPDF